MRLRIRINSEVKAFERGCHHVWGGAFHDEME